MSRKKSDYEELRDVWYKKLADEGFEDIEQDEDTLKTWSNSLFQYHSEETRRAKRDYYELAELFMDNYKFENDLDKTIWAYHVNGLSYRKISSILTKAGMKNKGRGTVFNTLKKLKNKMYDMYLAPKKEYRE